MTEIKIIVQPWGLWKWHWTACEAKSFGTYEYGVKYGRERAEKAASKAAAKLNRKYMYTWDPNEE